MARLYVIGRINERGVLDDFFESDYNDRRSAIGEAREMAKESPDCSFVVYESVGRVSAISIRTKWVEDQ